MARLPQPGGDDGNWGEILNEYLSESLTSAGKVKPGAVTKSDVGLGNVNNTSDIDKPVSIATQAALTAAVRQTGTAEDFGTWANVSYPDAIQTAKVAPATPAGEINTRQALRPAATPSSLNGAGARLGGRPGSSLVVAPQGLQAGARVNVWQETEGLDYARVGMSTSPTGASTDRTATIVIDGIKLARIQATNFYHTLQMNIDGWGRNTFELGADYLVSYYVWLQDSVPRRIAVGAKMDNGGDFGHHARIVEPGTLTRLWFTVRVPSDAASPRQFQVIRVPSVGFSADSVTGAPATSGTINFFQSIETSSRPLTMYVGGFQIEKSLEELLGPTLMASLLLVIRQCKLTQATRIHLRAARRRVI